MMKAYFNIGLNVAGREPAEMLNRALRAATEHGYLLSLAITPGEWEGVPERSLQILLDTHKEAGRPEFIAAEIAATLEQDGVAWMSGEPLPGRPGPAIQPWDEWEVISPDGSVIAIGSLADFPITC